ncbi:MAG: hypothetical protein KF832_09965 [Caldilineaceae bacterium]|nr:hypothetical protein [Caldilineaceae bacterium]
MLRILRSGLIACSALWLMMTIAHGAPQVRPNAQNITLAGTIPPVAPVLHNGDFECAIGGYYTATNGIGQVILIPNHWQADIRNGAPRISSTRTHFTKSCTGSGHVERISGEDSMTVIAQDLERPPDPGKPFDVVIFQPISTTVGGAYSLSGWLLSLCGGSAVPSDCPSGYYMSKMLGIDPTGGTDADAPSVIWTENRRNFWESGKRVGWQQMTVSAVAQAPTITLFARIYSPFRWHGNHAFIDALSLVRAPVVTLTVPALVTGTQATVQWDGRQSPDIAAIAGGTYALRYDLQMRPLGATDWRDFAMDQLGPGSASLSVPCADTSYEVRIRARSEQPPAPAPAGAWPNQRYASVWSDAVTIEFQSITPDTPPDPVDPPGPFRIYLPQIANQTQCAAR